MLEVKLTVAPAQILVVLALILMVGGNWVRTCMINWLLMALALVTQPALEVKAQFTTSPFKSEFVV